MIFPNAYQSLWPLLKVSNTSGGSARYQPFGCQRVVQVINTKPTGMSTFGDVGDVRFFPRVGAVQAPNMSAGASSAWAAAASRAVDARTVAPARPGADGRIELGRAACVRAILTQRRAAHLP